MPPPHLLTVTKGFVPGVNTQWPPYKFFLQTAPLHKGTVFALLVVSCCGVEGSWIRSLKADSVCACKPGEVWIVSSSAFDY